MLAFKVTTVGSSAGIILSKEVMARLGLQKGDTVFLTEAPDGSYRLTPYNPEFERQMRIAEQVMHDDRDLLRALAKRTLTLGGAGCTLTPFMIGSWLSTAVWPAYATEQRSNPPGQRPSTWPPTPTRRSGAGGRLRVRDH